MAAKNPNPPKVKVRDGTLSLAGWVNKDKKEGRLFMSFTISKSYKDDSGEWKNTDSLSKGDLLKLAKLCHLAYDQGSVVLATEKNEQNLEI